MKKHAVFISVPMSEKTDAEIKESIQKAKKAYLAITERDISNVAFVDNTDVINLANEEMEPEHLRVWYLGHALTKLSTCDEAFFWLGWGKARGCMIEYEVCSIYDIPTLSVNHGPVCEFRIRG